MTAGWDQDDSLLIGSRVRRSPKPEIRMTIETRSQKHEAGRLIARVVAGVVIGAGVLLVLGVMVQLAIWAARGVQG